MATHPRIGRYTAKSNCRLHERGSGMILIPCGKVVILAPYLAATRFAHNFNTLHPCHSQKKKVLDILCSALYN
jgi:hypothetical protein